MLRRTFMGAISLSGLAVARPSESEEGRSLFPGTVRTGTWRTVITFDLGPGGAFHSCLKALKDAGLESDWRALIMEPGRFKVVRPEGDILTTLKSRPHSIDSWGRTGEAREFELRQYF